MDYRHQGDTPFCGYDHFGQTESRSQGMMPLFYTRYVLSATRIEGVDAAVLITLAETLCDAELITKAQSIDPTLDRSPPSRGFAPLHVIGSQALERWQEEREKSPRGERLIFHIQLGELIIEPHARCISVADCLVELGNRTFNLLMVLLRAKGDILSRDELLDAVWPDVTVSDGNLKVQISHLRRALGAERWRVKTVCGRGYFLVSDDMVIRRREFAEEPQLSRGGGAVIVIDIRNSSPESVTALAGRSSAST